MLKLKQLSEIKIIPLSLIDSPSNLIRPIDGAVVTGLRDSLETYGQLQNIIVRPKPNNRYEVVAGNQRYYAAKGKELKSLECKVMELTDSEAIIVALIENIHHVDMNPWDEGKAFVMTGKSPEMLSQLIKKSIVYIEGRISIYKNFHPDLIQYIGKTLTITNVLTLSKHPRDKQIEVYNAMQGGKKLHTEPNEYQRRKSYATPINKYDTGYGGQVIDDKDVCVCPKCGKPHMRSDR